MIVFYAHTVEDRRATLIEDEYRHCTKVLRHRIDDQIHVTDGRGVLYQARIMDITKRDVILEISTEVERQPQPVRKGIAIAPTKNIDRFEWFLEKSTEIGITDIHPFLSRNSERKVIKAPRLQRIITSAMKQSMNLHRPVLHSLQPLDDILTISGYEQRFLAHCQEPSEHLKHLYTSGTEAIVGIGPEGDFAPDEITAALHHRWVPCSLGASRLRTETAGIVAIHTLNL